ncbi:hypothetical protein Chor_011396 [Crotalus horridus]
MMKTALLVLSLPPTQSPHLQPHTILKAFSSFYSLFHLLRSKFGMEVIPQYASSTKSPSVFHSVLHIFRTKRLKMGVKVKYLDNNEGYRFSYFTRGEPGSRPSVLMLHGFSLNKDMWLNTIQVGLPFTYSSLGDADLILMLFREKIGTVSMGKHLMKTQPQSLCSQCLFQFVEYAGLNHKPFHLVGMSMGGMVAGVYAALYPAHVSSLALLCPAGKYLHQKGFLDLTSTESRYSLHEKMWKIKVPTQIIWGKEDKVFDSSGAEILADAIPNSQVHRLEKCGHFITLERPRTSARLLLEFYNSVCDSAKQKKVA